MYEVFFMPKGIRTNWQKVRRLFNTERAAKKKANELKKAGYSVTVRPQK